MYSTKGFGERYNILVVNQQGRDHFIDQSVVEVIVFKFLRKWDVKFMTVLNYLDSLHRVYLCTIKLRKSVHMNGLNYPRLKSDCRIL
jgi:hypothetical protein